VRRRGVGAGGGVEVTGRLLVTHRRGRRRPAAGLIVVAVALEVWN
jgi:hypothetical protein